VGEQVPSIREKCASRPRLWGRSGWSAGGPRDRRVPVSWSVRLRFGFQRCLYAPSPSKSADGATSTTERRESTSPSRLRRGWRRTDRVRPSLAPHRSPLLRGGVCGLSPHEVTRAAGRSARPGRILLGRYARYIVDVGGDGARRNCLCRLTAPVDRPRGENRSIPCRIE